MKRFKDNVIYFSGGGNPYYSLLLELCLISVYLTKFSQRIIVLADQLFISILDNSPIKNFVKFEVKLVDSNDGYHSALNKFSIFNHVNFTMNERILYLDSDIILIDSIEKIFEMNNSSSEIFVSNDSEISDGTLLMDSPHHGGLLFNDEQLRDIKKNKMKSINSGAFLFSVNSKDTFSRILNISSPGNICLEQPFFNYILYHEKNYKFHLQNYITHSGYKLSEKKERPQKPIVHFCGGPGKFRYKFISMVNYMDLIFSSFTEYLEMRSIIFNNFNELKKEFGEIEE